MDYFKYQIITHPSQVELLIALFSPQPFDTFQENETGFDAYVPVADWTEAMDEHLAELHERFEFSLQKEMIPGQNWNVIWESNFHPVVVEDFVGIRADFHEPLQHVHHELVINPKMAFGTGHHETTWSVISLMRDLDFEGQTVLDFGCGTGVLAILASRLGAAACDAVDIEEPSFENTQENCLVNGVENVRAFLGELGDVPGKAYGIVLANINRNVILDSLPALSELVKPEGLLVVSGFIQEDEQLMTDSLAAHGFQVQTIRQRNNWLAMVSKKG